MTARTIAASAAREAEHILAAHHPDGTLPIPVDTIVQRLDMKQGRKQHDGPEVGFAIRSALGDIRAGTGLPAGSTATMAQERAANRFAAELFMPEAAVMREVSAWLGGRPTGTDRERLVNDLHKLFAVPAEAMAFRLVDLAIIVP